MLDLLHNCKFYLGVKNKGFLRHFPFLKFQLRVPSLCFCFPVWALQNRPSPFSTKSVSPVLTPHPCSHCLPARATLLWVSPLFLSTNLLCEASLFYSWLDYFHFLLTPKHSILIHLFGAQPHTLLCIYHTFLTGLLPYFPLGQILLVSLGI